MQRVEEQEIENRVETRSVVELQLPHSFDKVLASWPELYPLLIAFAQRDPGTFMHSVAVLETANKLASDLFLRFPNPQLQKEIELRMPFWLLHDIGKVAADTDKHVAQFLVHPVAPMNRPQYDKARHWIHPQMSADILRLWAKDTNSTLQPTAYKWAELAGLHDVHLNIYLPYTKQNLDFADRLALLLFSLADTSMAMGLPRPNKRTTFSDHQIRHVLYTKFLQEKNLKKFFAGENLNHLQNYITVSVLESLKRLQGEYDESVWTNNFVSTNKHFAVQTNSEQQQTQLLDYLVTRAWNESEAFWEATILRMVHAGVL